MKHSHLSDQQLLLDIEGQLSKQDEKPIREHIDSCWKCKARRHELESAIYGFIQAYQQEFAPELPPSAGPRALLKARMAQLSAGAPARRFNGPAIWRGFAAAVVIFLLAALALQLGRLHLRREGNASRSEWIVSIPDSQLTPGAKVLSSRPDVCAQPNVKNKEVSAALQKKVFEEYGITGADPQMYEVDYLVTPALGGADDIRNIWPHSHSSTVWNSEVKDALEDRLRDMVCDGSLDLAEAQQEIATNWITAYKKYFHTSEPLLEHLKH